ncbi:LAQU0S22e00408g1_1 [Lachancea quebecensis]|uniref:LAQU0S22e00408g1_1 n=1 Tax=Lachancea quebecensis TaxID=1654605 RepID=A0A0P1KXU5_9SACH|nr:LAQU0S22e00408g1_1 [Lachancea quebecensis]
MTKVVNRGGREVLVKDEGDQFSYLSLVDEVDLFPEDYLKVKHFQQNVYHLQTGKRVNIGFVLKNVALKMAEVANPEFSSTFELIEGENALVFKSETYERRNDSLSALARVLQKKKAFECLSGWRNEFYTIYVDRAPYVLVERALSGLLGVITYGVHVNGFVKDPSTGEIKFWIPRRSATKPTWPLKLDNIVAGGLGYPNGIFETVVKESLEEANLEQQLIEKYIKAVGTVSYFYFQGDIEGDKFQSESSLITGEVEYLFDLELPPDVIPCPNDDEVDSFQLMTLQQTINALKNKEFKPNCGLIMLEFLMRHGYINSENERNYGEIISRVHRRLPFPTLN